MPPAPHRRARLIAVGRIVAGAIIMSLVLAIWWHWDDELTHSWQEQIGPIPFFSAMALLPAVGVPMTPFFVVAGAAFEIWTALIGSLCAVALNLLLCYRIAHSGFRPRLERLLTRTRYSLPNFGDRRSRAIRFTVLVKVAPGVPAFAKNYIIGLAGVSLPVYFIVSLLFTGLYGASFIVIGDSALDRRPTAAIIAIAILLVLGGAGALWYRRQKNAE